MRHRILKIFGVWLCLAIMVSFTTAKLYAENALTIEISVKNHRFQPSEIPAPANVAIVLRVKNLDATPMEFESVSLRVEKVIAGNGQGVIRLRPLAPGRYKFFDDFHQETGQGVLVVQ
jgi:Cupredoxin-like domain